MIVHELIDPFSKDVAAYPQRLPADHLPSDPKLPGLNQAQPSKSVLIFLRFSPPPLPKPHGQAFPRISEVLGFDIFQKSQDPLLEVPLCSRVIRRISFSQARVGRITIFVSRQRSSRTARAMTLTSCLSGCSSRSADSTAWTCVCGA